MKRLGVITGLTREADCLNVFPSARRPLVRICAARTERAYNQSLELIAEGCQGLVSFGIAGGLMPDLKPGAVIIADKVVTQDGQIFETSEPWRGRFLETLGGGGDVHAQAIAGSDHVVATVAAKRALATDLSAVAVDMESHAVARAADKAGVPFLVVRAVADPLGRAIPEWVLGTISESGDARPGVVISGLLRNPLDFTVLMGLARDNAKAMAALRRVTGRVGPLFCLE